MPGCLGKSSCTRSENNLTRHQQAPAKWGSWPVKESPKYGLKAKPLLFAFI